jgi:hypothetical protein
VPKSTGISAAVNASAYTTATSADIMDRDRKIHVTGRINVCLRAIDVFNLPNQPFSPFNCRSTTQQLMDPQYLSAANRVLAL